ncbi:MAG: helix-turn-helix transcriptional regulator [Lachnospiraceae bacterium]|nr:helix-turn-helix transcriptional regulator [Lachnospiraceae bacterium]
MKVNYEKLGERIRKERVQKSLTQEVLAEKISVSCQHVGNIERAKKIPSVQVLADLAKELDVSIDYLLYDSQQQKESPLDNEIAHLIQDKPDKVKEHLIKYMEFYFSNLEQGR